MNTKLLLQPVEIPGEYRTPPVHEKNLEPRRPGHAHRLRSNRAFITDRILSAMSRWNDEVQLAIFNPNKPAPVYTEADITEDFPFNGYYPESKAPVVAEEGFKLELSGLIGKKESWTLEQLRALPQESQITRHICVEGWSAIGKWGGVRFSEFLRLIEADTSAKYVGFKCADKYHSSIDMATALPRKPFWRLPSATRCCRPSMASR